ncbi:hypothetical protein H663_000025 [Limnohabitans planktonicus II-D5]|uniref:Uncharacterized protein n=1 Tax=Limnohabitans planktonicus II-D5 TaxID=1293045 RepID=A0A2T7UIH0_9BURK|nr:hypothetical protein H663_000025 [Limnohabitans planktonicus II-D5]
MRLRHGEWCHSTQQLEAFLDLGQFQGGGFAHFFQNVGAMGFDRAHAVFHHFGNFAIGLVVQDAGKHLALVMCQ